MMFLVKVAFWLVVVLLFLPMDNEAAPLPEAPSAFEAVGAARDTVSDLSGFCIRNPQACATGLEVVRLIGAKAEQGARLLGDYLDEPPAVDEEAADTLTLTDRSPDWKGPKA